MAQKSGIRELIEFIPSMEQNEPDPTTVYITPLSKKGYDEYISELAVIQGRKIINKTRDGFEILCRKTLTAKDGVFLRNVMRDGKLIPAIEDKDEAVQLLLGLQNIECANEIEAAMRGAATLDEAEIKN